VTSIRHRLLIDECLPPALISVYLSNHIRISRYGVDAIHIKEYLGEGKKDPNWVPQIARDRRWFVLSMDKGKHGKKTDALPLICYEYKVTLILLSERLVQKRIEYYGPQILAHWHNIVKGARGPKGAQYLLHLASGHQEGTLFKPWKAPEGYQIESGELQKVQ